MNTSRSSLVSTLGTLPPLLAGLALAAAAVAPSGEVRAQEEPEPAVQGIGELAGGWMVRTDRPDAPLEEVGLREQPNGWRITLGPAAIFWRPENRAAESYRVRATFTQLEPPPRAEAYGLLVGGRELTGEGQEYLYFLVRRDGKFLVKRRSGRETGTLVPWTADPSVRAAGPDGRSTNTLAIETAGGEVRFLANGEVVARLERTPAVPTDGIVGIRVNHALDVAVTGFGIERGS